jgi:hypothetical protein
MPPLASTLDLVIKPGDETIFTARGRRQVRCHQLPLILDDSNNGVLQLLFSSKALPAGIEMSRSIGGKRSRRVPVNSSNDLLITKVFIRLW